MKYVIRPDDDAEETPEVAAEDENFIDVDAWEDFLESADNYEDLTEEQKEEIQLLKQFGF